MSSPLLLSAVTRLLGSVVLGAAAGTAVGIGSEPALGVLTGIATAATIFVVAGWFVLWPMDAERTRSNARREDFQPLIEETSVVVAALSGLVAIVLILVLGRFAQGHIAAATA
ncbi:DUF1345 domain-containing protein [Nocardia ignorata]|nr:DUF1345 domain-containing protein [Nocardia ignorata]